jgi:diguanylate cyclase (GGDEF)-like protein
LILQQKKPLYNFLSLTTLILLIATPVGFFLVNGRLPDFFIFPSVIGLAFFIAFKVIRNNIFLSFHGRFDNYDGKINILRENISEKAAIKKSLPSKHKRMSSLFNVSQNLIELSDVELIYDFLADCFSNLFVHADFSLLYEFNSEDDEMALKRSRKPDDILITEKRGDLIDNWVLRNNQTLIIEDITKDFRFDCQSIKAYTERGAHSFIVSPLAIAHKILGIARIESKSPKCFSIEDSRLICNICDLGAVVLERAHLFGYAQDLAIRDSLTSLFVKDYFYKQLGRQVDEACKTNASLGIIMIDIDDFKSINDTHGHIVGDAILRKISGILVRSAGGSGNIVSRFGGEEFIISVTGCDIGELKKIAEDIRFSVESAGLLYRRKKIIFTISCGISLFPDHAGDVVGLVEKADKRLYTAKSKGKNRVCFSG